MARLLAADLSMVKYSPMFASLSILFAALTATSAAQVAERLRLASPDAQFDVTDYLAKDGAENTVVICITRRSNSESLTGGILFPGWFFAGPRVPKSADAPDDFKIILPGMAN